MVTNVTGWETSEIEHYLDLREIPKLTQNKIIMVINNNKQSQKPVDGTPCQDCGGSQFMRTGTCLTCLTCGNSAGCG